MVDFSLKNILARPVVAACNAGLSMLGHDITVSAVTSESAAVTGHGYNAAAGLRRAVRGWFSDGASADSHISTDLESLRNASGDAYRNQPIATSAIRGLVTNVVGTGLLMQSRIDAGFLGLSDDEASDWQTHTEREFNLWFGSKDCDAAHTHTGVELQEIALTTALLGGDLFTLLPFIKRPSSPYHLCAHLFEGHQVSTPDRLTENASLVQGVETDSYGAPLAYWFSSQHPGGLGYGPRKWQRIPAFGKESGRRNVLHLFKAERPGQRRGFPYLSPVLETLKQISRLTEAELMAAVVSGMMSVFIESDAGEQLQGSGQDDQGNTPTLKSDEIGLGHGTIVDLAPGERINTAAPGRPNGAFDPFFIAIVRQIGAALEQPADILLKQFNKSYAASRAAFLMAWKFYKARRAWLTRNFCQPIYEEWLVEAITIGRVKAPGFFDDPAIRQAWCNAHWQGPAPGHLDPEKEVNAAVNRINNRLSTIAEETAGLTGGDYDDNHRQQVRERKMGEKDGLIEPLPVPKTKETS
ncbi:MAG: phage portal protein [Proteobacteria bacterium]|nr:phage portal protein [Pseudomonadota bacterium]MBU1640087.1 phage portal protein [Pseudomonadota bacterium]